MAEGSLHKKQQEFSQKRGGGRGRGRANTFQDLHIGFFLDLVTNFVMNFVTNFVIAKFGDKSKSSESRKTVP